jgi:predicted dehydrogenase
MGMSHVHAAAHARGSRLVATVDKRPQIARASAERYGASEYYTDYRSVLTRDDIDVVVVATWPSSHREIAVACLEAGKHVLMEKPITPSMGEGAEVLRAVRRTGQKLRIGYILRHNASYQRLVKVVRTGALGSPLAMRMLGGEHVGTAEHWRRDLKLLTETSPIIDCGCHYVDVMRWATGAEAVRVSGVGCRLESEVPKDKYDYGIITIAFSDGSSGVYEVGWTHSYRGFSEKEFVGPRGRLRLIYAGERPEHHEEGDLIELYQPPGRYRFVNVPGEFKPVERELADLLKCIDEDLDPMPALEDAMRSLQIVLAGDQAIRRGSTVVIEPWSLARLG